MMPGDVAAPKVPASAFAGKSETASTGHAWPCKTFGTTILL